MQSYHFQPERPPVVTPLKANARTPLITALKLPKIVTRTIRLASSSGLYQ